ncbi:hypothetical protein EB118_05820 [bacterium]|nr:hypothetical protein [bacterium]NDD82911.1 hypothetical protein [bacterium]NDG29599.1 hypothetical protein [bacterium]
MSYFNHAFQKTFVATDGFYKTAGAYYNGINGNIGTDFKFTFVDPNTWLVPDVDGATTVACPLVLVSSSIHPNDKIGPFHGGYSETVKSKTINPKYISRFYRVDPCVPQQAQITIGLNQDNFEDPGTCSKEFLCGETYYLRVDIKGSPVLRTLSRNTYYTADAYTGCCAADALAPAAVNPLIVYVNWAFNLLNSPLINPFIEVHITYSDDAGTTWLELGDGTSSAANLALLQGYTMNPSTLPANATPADTLAGLIIDGAYVDTRFETCTFYPNDSILAYIEPVKVYASEVDYTGEPCTFTGLCVNNQCLPVQGAGYGENILRSLILTEGYAQQPFYTGMDLRIREITNGTDVFNAIDKNSTYTRYYIQHSVPRFNNPTGTFDNDQYLLEIVTSATDANFETFMTNWLANANSSCVGLETFSCPAACTPVSPTND